MFDYARHIEFGRLIGSKSLAACCALPSASDKITLVGQTRVSNPGIRILTKWASHSGVRSFLSLFAINRITPTQVHSIIAYRNLDRLITQIIQYIAHLISQRTAFLLAEPTRGGCWSAYTETTCHKWFLWIIRDCVLVYGYMRALQSGFGI